jgi:cysteine desulfurase
MEQEGFGQSDLESGSLKQDRIDLMQECREENSLRKAVEKTAPHIISVSFAGIRSEVLLHALEEKKIYVSSGSACASNHPQLSGTLQAIGVKKELLDSTLRFSLSRDTTKEELDYTLEQLETLLPMLRRFVRH